MPAEETLLAEVPLFQALDPAERAALAAGMRQRDFPEGGRIFRRGDPGAALYVIARGAVEDLGRDHHREEGAARPARAG